LETSLSTSGKKESTGAFRSFFLRKNSNKTASKRKAKRRAVDFFRYFSSFRRKLRLLGGSRRNEILFSSVADERRSNEFFLGTDQRTQTFGEEGRVERFAERFVGRTARVLVEEIERRPNGRIVATGTTDRYFNVEIPLNDAASNADRPPLNVAASLRSESLETANGVALGDVLDVRLTSRRGDTLSGVRV
jgi:hypothetical protein